MRTSDILDDLKRRHPHLTEEQINTVVKSFITGMRYYFTHPEETKGGIVIRDLFTASIPPKKIIKFMNRARMGQIKNPDKVKTNSTEEDLEFYEDLLTNVKKYERQGRKKNDHE